MRLRLFFVFAMIATLAARVTAAERETSWIARADKAITYDTIMQAMNGLRAAGYLHVALVGAEGAGQ